MARPVDVAQQRVWQGRFSRFSSGNWSVSEFCEREGVSTASFYYWRRRLVSSAHVSTRSDRRAKDASSFLPVQVLVEQKLEVELPNGVVVRCPLARDGSWQQVLDAVSRLPDRREADAC